MLADTSLLRRPPQDKPGSDGPALLPALRRGAPPPASAAGKGEAVPLPAAVLDYAAFVLDQEAQYCQQ
jgi:hypothetical protein